MPKPLFPDRPIWPPLPVETERGTEEASGTPGSSEPVPADAEAPPPAGTRDGTGRVAG